MQIDNKTAITKITANSLACGYKNIGCL